MSKSRPEGRAKLTLLIAPPKGPVAVFSQGGEMRATFALIAIGVSIAFGWQSSALANPVTAKDLTGRKICWDYGNVSSFGPGGKYSSPLVGNGTWSVTSIGIQISTPQFTGIMDIDKQPDGTFQSRLEKGGGKYCK
jgi:hypothetical protein